MTNVWLFCYFIVVVGSGGSSSGMCVFPSFGFSVVRLFMSCVFIGVESFPSSTFCRSGFVDSYCSNGTHDTWVPFPCTLCKHHVHT